MKYFVLVLLFFATMIIMAGNENTTQENKTTEVKQKQEKKYKIEFSSVPNKTKVFDKNNNFLGETPFSVSLSAGFQKIKFEKEGYETIEKEIYVKGNEKITMEIFEKGKNGNGKMVKIPNKDYKMDITEVTVAQFKECVSAGKCSKKNFQTNSDHKYNNYGASGKENHPMNGVNWYGADEYCKWAGKRLPTEDEWEYAVKGGENYKYSGSENVDEVAWYSSNSGNSTHEVATKKSNGYGLYDMSGNVWEWAGISGVIFGGCFSAYANTVQVYSRRGGNVDNVSVLIGFRCVQDEK